MTTEERIADLETDADFSLERGGDIGATRALVYELRALRLMLREEIREAAWRLKGDTSLRYREPEVSATPEVLERMNIAVPERLSEAVLEGKDVP